MLSWQHPGRGEIALFVTGTPAPLTGETSTISLLFILFLGVSLCVSSPLSRPSSVSPLTSKTKADTKPGEGVYSAVVS
jgi:hypothetical protein